MNRLLIGIILLGSILVFLHSCEDDDTIKIDSSIIVEASSPERDAVFASGQQIPLKIEISQSNPILSYQVLIRNEATNKLVFILSEFSNQNTLKIDTNVVLEVSESTIMNVEVKAEDSKGNQFNNVVTSFVLEPPLGNVLGLRFNLSYDDEVLQMNKTYTYPTGEQFEFSRFDMYMTALTLIQNGQERVIQDIDYLSMTNTYREEKTAAEGFVYTVPGLADGAFDGLQFNIGLTPAMNATTPSQYPVSNPLGRSGEYWDSWGSYIFASIEGRINIDDSNPDLEQGIALHLGSNNAFQVVSMTENFSLGDNELRIIDVNIELKDLFIDENGEIYDITTTPQTHSLVHIPMVKTLSNNLKNSIKNQ